MRKFEKDEIYGKTDEELEKEAKRKASRAQEKQASHLRFLMLMPYSRFRMTWDAITILLVVRVCAQRSLTQRCHAAVLCRTVVVSHLHLALALACAACACACYACVLCTI